METITIAAVSAIIMYASPEHNLERIAHWTEEASRAGADLVLFNESSVPGYWYNVGFRDYAEPIDGPSMQRLHELARQHDIIICAGIMERDGDKEHNTQVLVGPEGLIGKHRKSALPSGEEKWFDIGNDWNVFDINGIQIGIAICYESVHPETCQKLTANGAEVILAPYMNGVSAREIADGKRQYFFDRARENGVWYVVSDQGAHNPGEDLRTGAVAFVNPFGEMVATTSLEQEGEHMIVRELDLNLVQEAREKREMAAE